MTTYATKKPIGSMDPKDLFDNAQNLDYALNDITKAIWTDRFGRSRKSYWGMEQAFSAQLLSQQQRFDNFIQSSGYQVVGEYTDGPLTISDYNQLIRYQNEFYKLTAATALPFTTTGNDATSWAVDSVHFVSVGDAALRQELAAQAGSVMVGYSFGDPAMFSYRKVADALKGSLWFDDFKGNTDDERWANLSAYLSLAVVSSISVMFSARTYSFTTKPAQLTKPFMFFGMGGKATLLKFTGCDGISADLITYNSRQTQSKIANMSIIAESVNTFTGLYFRGATGSGPHQPALILEDVSFMGLRDLSIDGNDAEEWAVAVSIKDTSEVHIRDLYVCGTRNNAVYATRSTSKAIFADTVSGLRISRSNINTVGTQGIEITGQSEGAILDSLTIVAADIGILFRDLVNPSNNHVVTNTHTSCYTRGIEFRKNADSSKHPLACHLNNLFILERTGSATKPKYTAIEMYAIRSSISNTTIQSNSATSPVREGIVVSNQYNSISNVQLYNGGDTIRIDGVDTGYVFYNNVVTSGVYNPTFLLGNPEYAIGAGLSSSATATSYTIRGDIYRVIDTQGREKYQSNGGKNVYSGGRQNSTVYQDFMTVPGGSSLYDARILFTGGSATVDGKADATIYSASVGFTGNLASAVANTSTCGTPGRPWAGGYTQSAFTVTSDERYKGRPAMLARGTIEPEVTSDQRLMQEPYADAILDAWGEVDFVQFQYIDRIEAKGDDGARWHVGVIAQRAQEAFIRHGLDPHRFAFFCYDPEHTFPAVYETVPAVFEVLDAEYDENGVEIKQEEIRVVEPEHQGLLSESYTVGEKYGIRYEEALVIEAAYQRRSNSRLLAMLENLKARIEALEGENHE